MNHEPTPRTSQASLASRWETRFELSRASSTRILTDTHLGGWSGTVKEVEQSEDEITYEIEWDKRTLDGMHPAYRKSCERDGFEMEIMWLGEEYIEPDDGTPVSHRSSRPRSRRRRCRRETKTIGSAWPSD